MSVYNFRSQKIVGYTKAWQNEHQAQQPQSSNFHNRRTLSQSSFAIEPIGSRHPSAEQKSATEGRSPATPLHHVIIEEKTWLHLPSANYKRLPPDSRGSSQPLQRRPLLLSDRNSKLTIPEIQIQRPSKPCYRSLYTSRPRAANSRFALADSLWAIKLSTEIHIRADTVIPPAALA